MTTRDTAQSPAGWARSWTVENPLFLGVGEYQ